MGLFKRKRKPDEETEDLKAFLDMIAPSIVKFETGYYICGNTFRCIWALREYPTSTDDLAILRHLGEKHGVTLHIYTRMVSPLEERKIVHNAEIRNRMNRGSAQDMQRAVEAESNLQDVANLIGSLHRNKEPLLHCAVYIEMIAGDMQELQILQTNVEVELMRSKLNVDRLKLRQQAGFCAVSPVGFNAFGTEYERVLPASSVANLFPFNYSGKTDRKGFYIGKDKYGSNIVVDFDGEPILTGLSLDIHDKEFVTLLGPSGCGKTTTLRVIGGFVEPRSGNVFFAGRDITRLPPERRSMGLVFQDYALFENMTVRQNVRYALRFHPQLRAQADERTDGLLRRLGLDGLHGALPARLSGGQRQRVALARTLALQPEIILFDEPMAALDAATRLTLREELLQLRREFSCTIVYVTHDQEEALTLSDRVMVMEGGRIRQIDTPENLLRRPADAYVREFVGENLLRRQKALERFFRPSEDA